jgi:hypothetical protein
LITLIKFGEVYKLWSSSLFNLLQLLAISSLLSPNILLRHLQSIFFCERPSFTPIPNRK